VRSVQPITLRTLPAFFAFTLSGRGSACGRGGTCAVYTKVANLKARAKAFL
jgi:hypothetical protein